MTVVEEPVAPVVAPAAPRGRRRGFGLALVAGAVVVLGLGAWYLVAVYTSHPMNPVIATDYADPEVVVVGDTYYAFATGVGDVNLQVRSSTDLKHWSAHPDALPHLPSWAVGGQAWAPTVAKFGDRWLVYFSAAIDYTGTQCIHVATATDVTGPYTAVAGAPFLCQQPLGGSIDPAVYAEGGQAWLVWKSDGDHIHQPTAIWAQELDATGLGFATGSQPAELLTDSEPWQAGIVEAPWLVRTPHGLRLFIATGAYDSADYAVAWAECTTPVGPCTLPSVDNPLVTSRGSVAGPGGASVFTDAVGNHWIAYHAWNASKIGYEHGGVRSLHVDRIDLDGPIPETPAPTGL